GRGGCASSGRARHGVREQDRAQSDRAARRLGARRRRHGRGAGKRARYRGLSRSMTTMNASAETSREILRVENLNQYYGGSHILRNVNLSVREGACTVLLGRNGVGKSTLLKTIMGLIASRSGAVQFEDTDLTGLAPYQRVRRGLGYVPQGREIFNRL